MSQILTNSLEYTITSENEIASILSKFNSEYLLDVIRNNLANKYVQHPSVLAPNIVGSFEQTFKFLQNTYVSDVDNILATREETYKTIINIICSEYNLIFKDTGNLDYFSIAHLLYDALVGNFVKYITSFFANYIYKEKNALYDLLNMESLKKSKDTSTIYGKKLYKDIKLAILNANIEMVVDSMSTFDITFEQIISSIYFNNRAIVNTILYNVSPIGDFYKDFYCGAFYQSEFRSSIITNIRLSIQNIIDPAFNLNC